MDFSQTESYLGVNLFGRATLVEITRLFRNSYHLPHYLYSILSKNKNLFLEITHGVDYSSSAFNCVIDLSLTCCTQKEDKPKSKLSRDFHTSHTGSRFSISSTNEFIVYPLVKMLKKEAAPPANVSKRTNLQEAIVFLERYILLSKYSGLPLYSSSPEVISAIAKVFELTKDEQEALEAGVDIRHVKERLVRRLHCYPYWTVLLKSQELEKVLVKRIGKKYAKVSVAQKLLYFSKELSLPESKETQEQLLNALALAHRRCVHEIENLANFNHLILKQAGFLI